MFFCARCGEDHEDGGLRCWVPFRSGEFWRGAAVAFGLMGMAVAIRNRNRCSFGEHDVYVDNYGDLECASCDWSERKQRAAERRSTDHG